MECHFYPAGCNIPRIIVGRVKIRVQLETAMVNRHCGDKCAGKGSRRKKKVDALFELDKKEEHRVPEAPESGQGIYCPGTLKKCIKNGLSWTIL